MLNCVMAEIRQHGQLWTSVFTLLLPWNWWRLKCCMSVHVSTIHLFVWVTEATLWVNQFHHYEEVAMAICEWFRVQGPVSTTMKLWICCPDRTSVLSRLGELEVVLQWSEWATGNMVSCHLVVTICRDVLTEHHCVTVSCVLRRCVGARPGWRPRTDQRRACHRTSWDTGTRSITTGHRVSCVLDWSLWKVRDCPVSLLWTFVC
jgi:hypothetical protein